MGCAYQLWEIAELCFLIGVHKHFRNESDVRDTLCLIDDDRVGTREKYFDVAGGFKRLQNAHVRLTIGIEKANLTGFRTEQRFYERGFSRPSGTVYDDRLRRRGGENLGGEVSRDHVVRHFANHTLES